MCEQVKNKQSLRVPAEGSLRRKTALPIVKFHVPTQNRTSRRSGVCVCVCESNTLYTGRARCLKVQRSQVQLPQKK